MSKKIRTFKVSTGVNPNFLESTLTEDINSLAALFDLIDNSIDAAREQLFKAKHKVDEYGLPADYSGYSIRIRIDTDSIRILDNCLGIEEEILAKKLFLIADTSDHHYGIGHYGIGLKRALLKFGSNYAMTTDTSSHAFKARFDRKNLGGGTGSIVASEVPTRRVRKTLFCVSKIRPEVRYEISSNAWFENAISELSMRYAVFLEKGLHISIRSLIHHQHYTVSPSLPSLRPAGVFPPAREEPISLDGVQVYIQSGIHQNYLFPREPGHSISSNKALTKQFGFYFICNDRVIVAASLARSHGWTQVWHSEYNGFVCLVRFVSEDSGKMPWNTAKTEIRTDSTIFLKAKELLQPCADRYRKSIRQRYSADKPVKVRPNSSSSTTKPASASKPVDGETRLHIKDWTTLLPSHFLMSADDVLNAYIHEAKQLEIRNAPYAAAMLYRALIEAATKRYMQETRSTKKVKEHFYSTAEGQRKGHSDEQKKAQGASPLMLMNWLLADKHFFAEPIRSRLVLAVKKTKSHLPFLNGIVHGLEFTGERKVSDIRNETVALLIYLVAPDIQDEL